MAKQLQIFSLFEPDTIAEFQYFRVFRAKEHFLPEEKLMFAVLDDAVDSLQKYHRGKSRRGRTLYKEALDWVLNKENEGIFAFENICDTLEIDSKYLRRGIMHWLDESPATSFRMKVWRTPLRYHRRVRDYQIAS